jgi:tetratricopeptide (TPR) repeat protein
VAEIRLQEYTAKIKDLIRQDRHEEAIAHCQHILRHYPRHVETYGLLGEACLDKGMVREAIEFFQRTLSADPENLMARVGLGVIYDEQGALLEAIWQMERAFELSPGNSEVRRELQRLYAQREGAEKGRLKLTRGALGRLYSRNGLYDQAIGEYHAILQQDPELPDIQVALIESLWREGRRLEAVEVSLDLIQNLPNCLKANLILGEIWIHGGHEEAGGEKLEVATALDPENRVAQELFGKDSPLPPEEVWLPELDAFAPEPGAAERGLAVAGRESGAEIPAWLQEMGFGPHQVEGEPLSFGDADLEPEPGEAVPAWLEDLMGVEVQGGPLAADEEKHGPPVLPAPPAWLADLEGEEVVREEPPPVAGIALPGEVLGAEDDDTLVLEEEPDAELPEWLQELGVPRRDTSLAAEGPPGPEEMVDLPDWLLELREERQDEAQPLQSVGEPEIIPSPEKEVPDWQRSTQAAEAQDLDAALPEAPAAGFAGEEAEDTVVLPAADVAPEAAPSQEQDLPDWLLALGAVETRTEAEEVLEEQQSLLLESESTGMEAPMPAAKEVEALRAAEQEAEAPAPAGGEVPEALRALVEAGILTEEDLAEAMAEMSPEDLEVQRAEAVPDWLQELIGSGEAPAAEEAVEAPLAQEETVEPAVEEAVAAAPPEELPAWLEELGAPEVEEAVEVPLAEEEKVEPAAEEAAEAAPPEELPAWLEELGAPEVEEAVETPLEDDIPAWLLALVEPVPEPEEAVQEPPEEEEAAWIAEIVDPAAEVPTSEAEPKEAVEAPPEEEEAPWEVEMLEAAAESPEPEPEVAVDVTLTDEEPVWVQATVEPEPEEFAAAPEPEEAMVVTFTQEVPVDLLEAGDMPTAEGAGPSPAPVHEEALKVAEHAPPQAPAVAAPAAEEGEAGRRLQELRDELQARPRDHSLRLEVARLSAGQREWNSALGHYERLIAARKLLPEALEDLRGFVDQDLNHARLYQLLGDIYMQQDQLDLALQMYRQSRQALLER